MELLQQQAGENSLAAYISVLIVTTGVVLGVLLLRYLVVRRLTRLATTTETVVDDLLVRLAQRINLPVVGMIAFSAYARVLALPEKAAAVLPVLTIAGVFVQVALWGETIIRVLVTRNSALSPRNSDLSSPAQRALIFLGRWLLWSLVAILVLENAGVDLSALLAGLGIGGIAVALAVQNILGDLFCFIAIILDKPFEHGDFVVVGDLRGTVERIGIKTTRIRSLDGEQLVFSNNDLVSSRVRNYKRMEQRRVQFRIGVTYETSAASLRRIPEIITKVFESIPSVTLDRVHFADFGDFSLNFEIVYFVLNSDYNRYMDVQQKVNLEIFDWFNKEEIDFAYPTQTMYLRRGVQSTEEEVISS